MIRQAALALAARLLVFALRALRIPILELTELKTYGLRAGRAARLPCAGARANW